MTVIVTVNRKSVPDLSCDDSLLLKKKLIMLEQDHEFKKEQKEQSQ